MTRTDDHSPRTHWCKGMPSDVARLGEFLPCVREKRVDDLPLSMLLLQAEEEARGNIHVCDVLDLGPD